MRKVKDNIISFTVWTIGLVNLFLWGSTLLFVSIFHRGLFFEYLLKLTCKAILVSCGIKMEIKGRENYDEKKQYVLMMNHVNMFDPFIFCSGFPGKARGLEEESHFKWPIYGWILKRIGNIPISRKSGHRAIKSLEKAAKLIQRKTDLSVIVLPEGTRTLNGRLSDFKKGGFLLAIESGLEILPLIQMGGFSIKRKGNWLVRPGTIKLIMEKSISTKKYSRENIKELIQMVRKVFLKYVN